MRRYVSCYGTQPVKKNLMPSLELITEVSGVSKKCASFLSPLHMPIVVGSRSHFLLLSIISERKLSFNISLEKGISNAYGPDTLLSTMTRKSLI